MPRQPVQSIENSFVKGLITEATGLTYPENACTETFDCRFLKTGEVRRRKGINFEIDYETYTLTGDALRSASAVTEYLWQGAAGNSNNTFAVIQVGQYLYFYKASATLSDTRNSLGNIDLNPLDLSTYAVSGAANPYEHPCSFASGDGRLFVVSKHLEPFYVEYDPSTGAFSGTQITIKVRDISGDTADPYEINERPTATVATVDVSHLYNLYNQGWAESVLIDDDNDTSISTTVSNPVTVWDSGHTGASARSDLPSNSDRWWLFKNAQEEFSLKQVASVTFSSGSAPKGHYILNAFDMDRDTASGLTGVTTTTSGEYRPSAVAFFANRVWYAGVDASGYNSTIYFSQILDDISKAGNCYQLNDPTDEQFYDLLANDGGTISTPAIANVVKLMVVENSLIIFATNGIWSISGSEGIGFTAVDFAVQKISDLQNRGRLSYVDVNGVPAWINAQGIYILKQDPITGGGVSSLSSNTIQTFFDEIPKTSIPYIKGVYNQDDKCVYWLYKSETVNPVDRNYEYDRVLVLNTETGAFYPWTIGVSSARNVLGIMVVTGSSIETSIDNVITSGLDDVVATLAEDQVVANTTATVAIAPTTKFLVEYLDSGVRKITWAEEFCTTYEDFNACTAGQGVDYSSYFISGYKLRGEGNKDQRTSYLTLHSRQETNSSVYLQGLWDYRNNSSTKRWSNPQQGYLNRANVDFVTRKLKIRGNGLALQIKCYSETNKPFNIVGWSILDTVGTVP